MARPESDPKTPLAVRLREFRRAIGDPDREALSTDLGISKNTLAYYERGERTPDADVLRLYSDNFGVDLNWLIAGEGAMFGRRKGPLPKIAASRGAQISDPRGPITILDDLDSGDAPARVTRRDRNADSKAARSVVLDVADQLVFDATFVRLPFYSEVTASAGPGSMAASEQTDRVVAFTHGFLRDLGAKADRCSVIRAKGDSMVPTIPDGAMLVVDHSQTEISNGCIMVIGVGDDLLVKRVRRRLDGLIDLISDNGAYHPETVGADRIQQLQIVGRVVYFCRAP